MSAAPLFYIRNTKSVVGNCALWWRPDGEGYTCDLRLAWKVPLEQAKNICRSRPEQDVYLPCEAVESIAQVHVYGIDTEVCDIGTLSAGLQMGAGEATAAVTLAGV